MKDYKIINNFLDKTFFKEFKDILFSYNFNWYYMEKQTIVENKKDDKFFLSHIFYKEYSPNSAYFNPYITYILKQLNCNALYSVRANLLTNNLKHDFSNFHVDVPFKCNTAVLYMNTNNGYTLLNEKEKIKITSEENKIVIFNSEIKHCAVSQTDEDRRIVINFNYF